MSVAIAGRPADVGFDLHNAVKSKVTEMLDIFDGMLAVHRANFVFREATPEELEEHEAGFKAAIRCAYGLNSVIADPDFDEPDLVRRLQIRIRQLEDAYRTFNGRAPSPEQERYIAQHVFPE
jgi:hypothetical protein